MFDRGSLMAVGELINNTLDFERSELSGRPTVRPGHDETLDRLRRDYDGMSILLEEVVKRTIHAAPQWAAAYIKSCVFLPQLGFLIAVEFDPASEKGKYTGDDRDDDYWQQNFIADGLAHYKNEDMRYLDEQFGDVYCEIAGMTTRSNHLAITKIPQTERSIFFTSSPKKC